ncbi:hypothetical protein BAUCODRAFT_33369 [Baudoinia panamericana UAMH 10762]|uniref:Uncharacterized protein n=1 Tax=Baudoinia panamericana (strain UAMH 10762) TaxID=717646 RepID=M2MLU8_BAUPA|nr:uncharacterized protein BAUCODRAFT_33369 [Baudoinia panamericana UAMH 10762]EMC97641.1 hypothetical protein BAUCODRAFT_33369 [Baudoinia panamericana UAMH 10762]
MTLWCAPFPSPLRLYRMLMDPTEPPGRARCSGCCVLSEDDDLICHLATCLSMNPLKP